MKKLFAVVSILFFLAAGTGVWYFYGKADAKRGYVTEAVSRGSIRNSISASGSLAALNTVEVGSQISGNILKLYADFNDEVKAGQLLAQLDSSTYEAQLQQALANLESARASELGIVAQAKNLQASMMTAKAEIQVSKANIRKSEVAVEDALRNFKRLNELFERKLVAASDRDSSQTQLDTQKASLDAVRAQYESSKARVMAIEAQVEALQADREGAKARIRQMEAQLSVARINLDRTSIYSPIDGVVISREVDEGQTVAASLQAPKIFIIAQDLKKMQIDVAVDEADIGQLANGQKVTFSVDAYKERIFSGIVYQVRLSPKENSNVVTYSVMVAVGNDDLLLKPGMTANADILVGDRQNVLRLPLRVQYFKAPDSLRVSGRANDKGNGSGKGKGEKGRGRIATDTLPVWVLRGPEDIEMRRVKIGISNQEFIELVSEELIEGDRVIVGVEGESSAGNNDRNNRRAGSVRMRF